jgi:hypothetical protein
MRILSICGKTSDRCSVKFTDGKGNLHEADSYVPAGINIDKDGTGDYIELDIDMDSGKVLNFKKLSDSVIIKAIKTA